MTDMTRFVHPAASTCHHGPDVVVPGVVDRWEAFDRPWLSVDHADGDLGWVSGR
jgi:hypothetical protein